MTGITNYVSLLLLSRLHIARYIGEEFVVSFSIVQVMLGFVILLQGFFKVSKKVVSSSLANPTLRVFWVTFYHLLCFFQGFIMFLCQ